MHTFEIEREDARAMGSLDDGGDDLTPEQREKYGYSTRSYWPLRRWYLWRVLTFWKAPYLLAEWVHRRDRPVLPEAVVAWSQALPEAQWAQPSAALVKANQIVKTAMDKQGATFVDACRQPDCSEVRSASAGMRGIRTVDRMLPGGRVFDPAAIAPSLGLQPRKQGQTR
ncbi:MAG: hypothetical protein ABS955_13910 [Stenotrophomonas maltophilia]